MLEEKVFKVRHKFLQKSEIPQKITTETMSR